MTQNSKKSSDAQKGNDAPQNEEWLKQLQDDLQLGSELLIARLSDDFPGGPDDCWEPMRQARECHTRYEFKELISQISLMVRTHKSYLRLPMEDQLQLMQLLYNVEAVHDALHSIDYVIFPYAEEAFSDEKLKDLVSIVENASLKH
jgi:hypothetical protein